MGDSPLTDAIRSFATAVKTCVVATTRPDGRVRQSVTYFHLDADDSVLISTTARRAKALDVARTGRLSICVFGHEKPFPSVTIEGAARILDDPARVGELTRRLTAAVFGGDQSNAPSDEDLQKAGRVILELTPERCYGASYIPEA